MIWLLAWLSNIILMSMLSFKCSLANDEPANVLNKSRGLTPTMAFGRPMKPDEYNFFVGIFYTQSSLIGENWTPTAMIVCSGTLITEKIVITAGHCAPRKIENGMQVYLTYEESMNQKNKKHTVEVSARQNKSHYLINLNKYKYVV